MVINMKKTKLIFVIGIQIILMANSCVHNNYYDFRLKVINKSNKTIYAETSGAYPDTSLVFTVSPFNHNPDKAAPEGTINIVHGGSWEEAFNGNIHQKLIVFIFDAAIADNMPWDTIKKKYLILKRYDLTLNDLDSLNFKVTYP